jgi:DnaD/phage-associated family protein
MSAVLGIDENGIFDSFIYLQESGLVQVLNKTPFEVRYLPIKTGGGIVRKYKPEKYAEFNIRIQEILSGRMISMTEYREYYDVLERLHVEQEVLLMAAKYSADLKGADVSYAYIITVTKNWAHKGVNTVEKAEEQLSEYNKVTEEIMKLLKLMGVKRGVDFDDRELYLKWTKGQEFSDETLRYTAKLTKKGGMQRLDAKLKKYYEAKLFNIADIEAYEKNKDSLFELARKVSKAIGEYYGTYDNVVDTYIAPWLNLGFESEALEIIANACFKRGIKTLEGMQGQVESFYRKGLLTASAIHGQMARIAGADEKIQEVLVRCRVEQSITSRLRDSYRTWTYSWGMPHEVVLYAAEISANAAQPIPYMNKILSEWNTQGKKTLDTVKADKTAVSGNAKPLETARVYSAEQLTALIDDIDNIDF